MDNELEKIDSGELLFDLLVLGMFWGNSQNKETDNE